MPAVCIAVYSLKKGCATKRALYHSLKKCSFMRFGIELNFRKRVARGLGKPKRGMRARASKRSGVGARLSAVYVEKGREG